MRKYIFILILLLTFVNVSFSQTEKSLTSNPTKLTEYVTDETGTLKVDEVNLLRSKLRKFYDSTSTQILVLLIPSLNGEPVEMVANSIYHFNGIGGKGKDNGALLLISKGDRKIRIEVGYGLEGVLTDAMSKQIIQKEITPELKKDNYYKGIDNAVNSIIALSKNEYSVTKTESKNNNSSGSDIIYIVLILLIPAIIFIVIIVAVFRGKMALSTGSSGSSGTNYYSGSGSNNYSSGSSDSSSSSGSDSGFSGGGGDSGGGGASGDY